MPNAPAGMPADRMGSARSVGLGQTKDGKRSLPGINLSRELCGSVCRIAGAA